MEDNNRNKNNKKNKNKAFWEKYDGTQVKDTTDSTVPENSEISSQAYFDKESDAQDDIFESALLADTDVGGEAVIDVAHESKYKLSPKKKKLIAIIVSGILALGLVVGVIVGIIYGINNAVISLEVDSRETVRARVDKSYFVPDAIEGEDPESEDYYKTEFSRGMLTFKGINTEDKAKKEENNEKIIGFKMVFYDEINIGNGYVVSSDFLVKSIDEKSLNNFKEKLAISNSLRLFVCVDNSGENESLITVHFMLQNQYFTLEGKSKDDEASIKKATDNLAGIARVFYNDYLAYIPTIR